MATHKDLAATALMHSIEGWTKYAADMAVDPEEFRRRELFAMVDYLRFFFLEDDEQYRHLYIGEKLKQIHDGSVSPEEQARIRAEIPAKDAENLTRLLRPLLSADQLGVLEQELRNIGVIIGARTPRSLRLLLIGDCIHLDILSFLVAPCLEDGVSIEPTFLTSKNAAELRVQVRGVAERPFDLVFYSPFSYEFSMELRRFMSCRAAFDRAATVREAARAAFDEAAATIDVLAGFFECPIYVHNTANTRRHDGSLIERTKSLLTRRVRTMARDTVNPLLAEHLASRSGSSLGQLFLLDELPILREHGEQALSRMLYSAQLQHPAELGVRIAREYRTILVAHALFRGKKLIMCDLDNTLWKGVIGEGAVEHYRDRQQALRRLRERGVLLAINSKNDPRNIRWDGAVLGKDDFVAAQVSWDPKVVNTRRIAESLNLKAKDFVFVDDRPDERQMVGESFPGLVALDAEDPRTWLLLDRWVAFSTPEDDTDRTRFYKERQQRQDFLDQKLAEENPAEMFSRLGLRIHIRRAARGDLRRVVELVNRTNQFNTCGSRITLRELTEWEASGTRRTLVASCADKFGDMGTICVLMYEPLADRLRIPVFVLSCRVFGYHIEHAMLNHVKRVAIAEPQSNGQPRRVEGLLTKTSHNGPCHGVYPSNGFQTDGDSWVYGPDASPCTDPSWLEIRRDDPSISNAAPRPASVGSRTDNN